VFRGKNGLRQAIAGAVDLASSSDLISDRSWIRETARVFGSYPVATGQITGQKWTFHSTGPDEFDSIGTLGRVLIVSDAALHNRADLLSGLSSHRLPPSCSDSALILAAYEKWGENCPAFLRGEFSFAIWDARRETLFCCRDHIGLRPFFYWTNGTRFAFSSDPLCLFRLPGICRNLNHAKLAAWTVAGFDTDARDGETFFRGVLSLPSATSLAFAAGRLRQRVYWTPEEASVRVPRREEDAFEALRELLFDAVECRVRGKAGVAAFLSGGLDSSALVGVAARCLQKSNRSVLALAGVLPEESKPQFRDEREFIDEFRAWSNVDIEHVAPKGGPFDGIDDPLRFEASPLHYTRQYLVDAMQDVAIRRGADVILLGMGGEAGPTTWGWGYYLELAFGLRWPTLAHELRRLRAVRHISPFRILRREASDLLSQEPRCEPLMLLTPDFLRAMEDIPRRRLHWPDHRRTQLRQIRANMRGFAFQLRTPESCVPLTLPFLDKRVLEYCLAAPGNLKVRDGYQRYMIRRALDGILPKRIQWRTDKYPFSPDYPKRYKAQLGLAREFVAAIRRNDPVRSVVDLHRLRHFLDHPDTPQAQAAALVRIPSTIYLICFLRQFAEFRP
jgi:asparagine synthase (glutamine-hydrolysing)